MTERRTIPEHLRSQVNGILGTVPTGRETLEDRTLRNTSLRQQLGSAPDVVIAWAAAGTRREGLLKRELLRRLEDGHSFPLEPLFSMVTSILTSGKLGHVEQHWLSLVRANVARIAPFEDQEEITNLIENNLNRIMERDSDLLEQTLSWREDVDDIIAGVLSRIPDVPESRAHRSDCIHRLTRLKEKSFELKERKKPTP